MTISRATTVDFGPNRSLDLPAGCISTGALYALANRMKALEAFHNSYGGTAADVPCLISVAVEDGKIYARLRSGPLTYKLELVGGSWLFT